ncbi:glycosyl transferase [Taibaiella sp. KBW10]|uniref:glycosyltransferase family 2 protein n=1 Tax=Taibaiella sp. KBW10 TaxID=2153357 RepID=UPI000F5A32EB|nr:glycosyltransferase family 2 protein [Taibaiella sp. KBW10]RQO32418.1 glycosyl transferase [Taibaiella sp. KBW10]
MTSISIVLPCYNPPEHWEQYVYEGYRVISDQIGCSPELIIVNDGSSQDIQEAIDFLHTKIDVLTYISYPVNKGKGAALREGVQVATTDYIIYTDIDFPYTTESFLSILEELTSHKADIAIGIKDDSYYQYLPKYRKFISKSLRKGISLCFRMPITDTQCGLKGFNKKGQALFIQTTINRYLFDLEFIYQAFRKKRNLIVSPIKISLRPNVFFRKMNLKVLAGESTNFLKILLKKTKY